VIELLALLLPTAAPAATLRVPEDFEHIRDALDSAVPCDVVEVAPGVYEESIFVPEGVTLRATGTVESTVIDAGGFDEVDSPIPSVVALTNGSVIEGFTIRNAFAGVTMFGNWAEVLGCRFEELDVGIAALTGEGWLQGNTMTSLRAKGIEGIDSRLWIDDLVVTGTPVGVDLVTTFGRVLRATLTDGGRGFTLRESEVEVYETTAAGNEVGGVVSLGSVVIEGGAFEDNLVGLHLLEGETRVVDNDFVGNGYGVLSDFSDAWVLANRIEGSTLGGWSEGVGSRVQFVANTLLGNPVGIEVLGGSPRIENCTVVGGSQGIVLRGGAPVVRNAVVVDASDVGLDAAEAGVGTVLEFLGLFGNGTDASGYIPGVDDVLADPLLDAAGVPLAGSPLIDAGDPGVADVDGSRSDLGSTGGPSSAEAYVVEPPAAPTIGEQPLLGVQEGDHTTVFAVNVVDPNGDPLRIAWDTNPDDGLQYCDGVSVGVPFVAPDDGEYEVAMRVQDSQGFEVFATVPIDASNGSPDLDLATLSALAEGTQVPVFIQAWDPSELDELVIDFDGDGDAVFEVEGVPPGFLFWTPLDSGTWEIAARARDDDGGEGGLTRAVTVANLPPFLVEPPPAVLADGEVLDVELQVGDPSPLDVVTVELVAGPPGMTLAGRQLSWDPTGERAVVAYTLRLSDDDGGELEIELTLDAAGPSGDGCDCAVGGGGAGGLALLLLGARRRR